VPAPFGGHPTLNEYLQWAYSQGCRAKSGIMSNPGGPMCSIQIIRNADESKHAIVADMPANERLSPSYVRHLDDRLGLKSPFARAPALPE
jgi:hypothetical protein